MSTWLPTVLATAVSAAAPSLPGPADVEGWGLRVRRLDAPGWYLAGEPLGPVRIEVRLTNRASRVRPYPHLEGARSSGDLSVTVTRPDGTPLPSLAGPFVRRPGATRPELPAGGSASAVFRLRDFGYDQLREPGEYRLTASLKTPDAVVPAPPLILTVADVPPAAVLVSHLVPPASAEAKRPEAERVRAFVQQVRVGGRVLLIYRRFVGPKFGGGVDYTFRLAELDGEVEMKVGGAYGEGKPLVVAHRDPAAGWVILTVNSTDGTVERRQTRRD
jgi:hypothetical protein